MFLKQDKNGPTLLEMCIGYINHIKGMQNMQMTSGRKNCMFAWKILKTISTPAYKHK